MLTVLVGVAAFVMGWLLAAIFAAGAIADAQREAAALRRCRGGGTTS